MNLIQGLNMFLFPINISTFHFSHHKIFLQLLVPKKFQSPFMVHTFKSIHVYH